MHNADEMFKKETIAKYFTSPDKEAFRKQLAGYGSFRLDPARIIRKKIISWKLLLENVENKAGITKRYLDIYGESGYYNITFPLFSADNTKMLIQISAGSPYGSAGGAIYIFEKRGDKWKMSEVLYGHT